MISILIGTLLAMALMWAIIVHDNPEVILGGDGLPYLVRYFIWRPKDQTKHSRLYLHHIVASDEDRSLHDHPWNFLSLILKGGYYEHADIRQIPANDTGWIPTFFGQERKWFGATSLLIRGAGWRHRIELRDNRPAWTLVYTSPKVKEWGFFIDGEYFCHHTKYDNLTGLCNED